MCFKTRYVLGQVPKEICEDYKFYDNSLNFQRNLWNLF